ncbi:hypothetical protein CFBP6625_17500 [Agrobacterium tumefaciens]|nr:hypothetical protein CFBP6625_17500 [Agrobacterium tumefaciens]
MAGCRVILGLVPGTGMTEERSATIDINPAIPPGFLLPETGLRPFCRLRAASPFSEKTFLVKQVVKNSDAGYPNSEKISFIKDLERRNSSFQSKNCFLDARFSRLHCVHEISLANDGCHGQGYAFFDCPRF